MGAEAPARNSTQLLPSLRVLFSKDRYKIATGLRPQLSLLLRSKGTFDASNRYRSIVSRAVPHRFLGGSAWTVCRVGLRHVEDQQVASRKRQQGAGKRGTRLNDSSVEA